MLRDAGWEISRRFCSGARLLAQALEATNGKDEAAQLYKEVAENNFNTVDFAPLRAPALKKVG